MVRIGDWISEAWEIFKQDPGMHIVVFLVLGVASGATGGFILIGPLMCGYYYMILKKLRQPSEALNFGDIAKGFEVFVPSLIATILVGIFMSVGLVVFLVGMIVVQALLMFVYPLIMDRRMDFWPAIETSFNKTRDNWLGFSLFMLALTGIYLLGVIACGVGVLVTAPLCIIATALAYRDNFGLEAVVAEAPAAPAPPPPTPPSAE